MVEGRIKRWRPTPTSLVAGTLIINGFWLSSLSWWFFILVGLGSFGPGLLRELGLLHDRDEFQRRADHRAGYHAFLTTGLAAFGLVAFFHSGERTIRDPQELATLLLVLLWFTWILSMLVAYWRARNAAARILLAFGSFVLAFTVASNLGEEWTGWAALLLHPLIALPFFGLAWMSRRWPRVAGILLLASAVFFFQFLGFRDRDSISKINHGVVFIVLIGPLLAAGVALLAAGRVEERDDGSAMRVDARG